MQSKNERLGATTRGKASVPVRLLHLAQGVLAVGERGGVVGPLDGLRPNDNDSVVMTQSENPCNHTLEQADHVLVSDRHPHSCSSR